MPVKLIVERQTLSFETDAIGIGRDPDNQVALPNDARLAPLHAVIRHVNGRWIVESREGGPIRVGNGRPTQFAWLNPGDVIHLTESGPQLVFEPTSNELSGTVPSKPAQATVPAFLSPPHIPFIPDISGNKAKTNPTDSDKQPVLKPAKAVDNPPPKTTLAMPVIGAISFLILVGAGWAFWTSRSQAVVSNPNTHADNDPPLPVMLQPEANVNLPVSSVQALEPAEFLVVVGIGNIKSDDRPHVLGVGWLWDDRTAVTSREIGEAINEVVDESRNAGSPRQGCVIQGVAFEVVEVRFSNICPEISILKLKDSTGLPLPARKQISLVGSKEIQRQLHLKKTFTYISYGKLTRPPGVKGNHPFPLCEYDTDKCQIKDRKAQFLFETGKHFLKPGDAEPRLEAGGLIFDDGQKVSGMTLSDSSIVWAETLERALDAR